MKLPLDAKIYVTGHQELIGAALLRKLEGLGYRNVVTRTGTELDLRDQEAVNAFFEQELPDYVFLAATRLGSLLGDALSPAQSLYDNLLIAANVIHASYLYEVEKLLNVGCNYACLELCPTPLQDEALLSGLLEETNRSYAVARIAAIELCDSYRAQYGCDFVSVLSANLYGPGDAFHLPSVQVPCGQVIPALLRELLSAKEANRPAARIGGGAAARYEFLYVDDLADACLFLIEHFSEPGPINVGPGEDVTLQELSAVLKAVVGYGGELAFEAGRLGGASNPSKIAKIQGAGWKAKTPLRDGVRSTLDWYLSQRAFATQP